MLQDVPVLPSGCEELWSIFIDLHANRGNTGFGPARITYVDIDAYQRVTGNSLAPWELAAIRKADSAYLNDFESRRPEPTT